MGSVPHLSARQRRRQRIVGFTRCVFCGGQPVSDEDIYTKWLRRHVLRKKGADPQHLMSYSRKWVAGNAEWERARRALTDKVHAPCRRCNSGWMSGFEQRLHSPLASMIDGNAVILTESQQRDLASWALIKAMMITLAKVSDVPRFKEIIPKAHFCPSLHGPGATRYCRCLVSCLRWRPHISRFP